MLPDENDGKGSSIYHDTTTIRYEGGDLPKPETNKNFIRLYNHMLCPFCERARLALLSKGIVF